MQKMYKKSINLSLMLSISAFAVLFMPFNAVHADYNVIYSTPVGPSTYTYNTNYSDNNTSGQNNQNNTSTTQNQNGNNSTSNSNGANNNSSNSSNTATVKSTSSANTGNSSSSSNGSSGSGNYLDLAGNALVGSNGFMPSGIIGWVLFAILVLIIVIMIRKISGAEERYHSSPLKHE